MNTIASTLTSILGGENTVICWENLASGQKQNLEQSIDSNRYPICVVSPNSQAELAAVITTANSHQWRVLACGSGSKINWGGLAKNIDIVVS
ncbi:MAG: FAD-binding protein, partial [Dolichospermum sp.]